MSFWFDWLTTFKVADPTDVTYKGEDMLAAFEQRHAAMLVMQGPTLIPSLNKSAVKNEYAFAPMPTIPYGMTKLAFQPGFAHRWGHLKCTPDDLAALMGYILDKLLPDDRAYLVDAMRSVGAVQRWGVWGAGPDQHPGNKDGWSVEPDGGTRHWVADTVGFAGPDERYVVAAMYHVPPSAGTTSAGVHSGALVVSDLVATVFGAPVPAAVSVPDHE